MVSCLRDQLILLKDEFEGVALLAFRSWFPCRVFEGVEIKDLSDKDSRPFVAVF